ncbi:DUF2848 domain-containing protein [Stappia sp. ES.058]|uniref:DUF2848 domain-containing protein n=1 Tax=Stappia sp. ES.058 TaxID=1881061 RepID=UPI00087C6FE5|nr:DUF2848 domain-containing protein [Stappia sp. ES.058]SDU33370.1 Protein of unknown function [Stappia sp. ES.058]
MDFFLDDGVMAIDVRDLTVAGWTGRDPEAIRHHIDELAELGVVPPSAVPLYYRCAADQLTQASEIEVVGEGTSGEVEPFVVSHAGDYYLGLASDHTDRELEAHSVALSKQICAKPVARDLWRLSDVANRLESLELRSWIQQTPEAEWTLYQEGTIASIRPLQELIAGAGLASPGRGAAAVLCGTFGAIGGVRPAAAFRMELRDPELDRTIAHRYQIRTLPIVA